MKTLRRYKLSQFMAILLFTSGSLVAQTQQKVKKNYPMNNDATIAVDAQHTKLVFETWDKNEMQIEAFIDTKGLSEEEVKKALEDWQVSVKGDKSSMTVTSNAGGFGKFPPLPNLDSLQMMTTHIIGPIMDGLAPMIADLSQHPPLPPEFMASVSNLKFDHEAYKRDGEEYMKKWEKEMEEKFGKDVEIKMQKWSENFEKDAEKWSAQMEKKIAAWEKEHAKDMEAWAEQFGTEMEAWGEQFGKEMEVWAQQFENAEGSNKVVSENQVRIIKGSDSKAKKTLIIRMPKNAKLKLEVRFGEVQLADKTTDLRAQISHSNLIANTIGGKRTKVEVSYSPVKIKVWDYGVLNTNYVHNASIDKATSLKLASASSNVKIGEIKETAVISGTFGNLDILKLAPDFNSVDISLENSNLDLNIPKTALDFNYTGSQSTIEYPSSIKAKPIKSYDSELINGYQNSANGSGIVIIKAKFSEVTVE